MRAGRCSSQLHTLIFVTAAVVCFRLPALSQRRRRRVSSRRLARIQNFRVDRDNFFLNSALTSSLELSSGGEGERPEGGAKFVCGRGPGTQTPRAGREREKNQFVPPSTRGVIDFLWNQLRDDRRARHHAHNPRMLRSDGRPTWTVSLSIVEIIFQPNYVCILKWAHLNALTSHNKNTRPRA